MDVANKANKTNEISSTIRVDMRFGVADVMLPVDVFVVHEVIVVWIVSFVLFYATNLGHILRKDCWKCLPVFLPL